MREYFTWREIEDIELIAHSMDFGNRGANTWTHQQRGMLIL